MHDFLRDPRVQVLRRSAERGEAVGGKLLHDVRQAHRTVDLGSRRSTMVRGTPFGPTKANQFTTS